MKADTMDKSPTLVNGQLPDPEKVNGVEQELEHKAHESGINAAFALKVALINQELAQIGMGRYQIMLFFTAGMGWFVDNLFLQGIAIILPSIQQEFDPAHVAHSTLALFCGLCIGAAFWGCSADIVGRRVAFNITLFISGAFGIIAGASTSFSMWCGFVACIGFGLGGNLPVDGALYLEVLPASYQWTLTLLSAFWAIGQVVGSVIVWPMVINFSCPLQAEPSATTGNDICQPGTFARSGGSNQGWRYSMYIFGGMTVIMWMIRFFAFPIQESPKWLAAKNRDVACIAALQKIAKTNRTTCTLTVEDLQNASMKVGVDPTDAGMSIMQTLKNSLSKLSLSNITPLFSTTRLAINTTLITLIWGLIGLAYPLFNAFLGLYLTGLPGQTKNSAYSNYAIQAACGVPGSIIAAILVEWRVKGKWSFIAGRKGAMALSTLLSGVFLFLFTQATTNQAVLGWNCASALTQNAMYGILYAYTPEVFPTSSRGSGNAICASLNRMFGIIAPLLQSYASSSAATPVFISASLFIVSGCLMLALPIDTAGVDAL